MSEQSKKLLAQLQQNKENTEAIQAFWRSLGTEFATPEYLQCSVWLNRHDFDTVMYGLQAMASNLNKKRQTLEEIESDGEPGTEEQQQEARWSRTGMMKYASGAMKRRKERGE
jgi:hypothetical protein